ncbi:hypothetical protein JRO89_XS14G0048500 [Xanthoceras sorbifolium]|uniref:Chalcone-flavonone isomerase family protein n=1 Tax=Xanthoceras sorbifolium TaxID=99658 RepID=A0ABQ8H3Z6_9ROSI|nr:hypothetical protein JRO89_XS14G0048500 [Xanthoceras sorbifolium]
MLAGVRDLEIEGKLKKFTAIGVYLEDNAVPFLASKWKGKTVEELTDSVEFFRDIVTGPFEKFTQVSFISPLTGIQYTGKVVENCIAFWKSVGVYTEAQENAIEELLAVFKNENFPTGTSLFFTHLPQDSFTISFSKDTSIPEIGNAEIKSRDLSETVLETIIGKNGVSPAARQSLAARLSELMKD